MDTQFREYTFNSFIVEYIGSCFWPMVHLEVSKVQSFLTLYFSVRHFPLNHHKGDKHQPFSIITLITKPQSSGQKCVRYHHVSNTQS